MGDVVATVQDAAASDEEVVAVLVHLFVTRHVRVAGWGCEGRAAG